LFQTYADTDTPDVIAAEGFEKLFNDAEISVEGAQPMLLSWQMGAKEMLRITKEEWTKGTAMLKYVLANSG
jgi:DCN1-like protein 4/5